jgi:hypothetical protein
VTEEELKGVTVIDAEDDNEEGVCEGALEGEEEGVLELEKLVVAEGVAV